MNDLSLHILDIAENSIGAGATLVTIAITEDTVGDLLTLEIGDNGKGMSADAVRRAIDPFYTTRTTRKVGLGLSLLSQSAREAEGGVSVTSQTGAGTKVTATFRHSHIDRKPLGDLAATMSVLVAGNPAIDFVLAYGINGRTYSLDTRALRRELEEVPLNAPPVIAFIRDDISEGIAALSEGDARRA